MKALKLHPIIKAAPSVIMPTMLIIPAVAAAQFGLGDVCTKAPFLAGCESGTQLAFSSGGGYLSTLVDTFLFVAAIVSVFFILIAGIKYITAGGDPARTVSAKNTLQYAIVGLIVAILARAIVGFIVGRV